MMPAGSELRASLMNDGVNHISEMTYINDPGVIDTLASDGSLPF